MVARWNPVSMMLVCETRGMKRGRRPVCLRMEALEARGLLSTLGVLHPMHPVDRPDRLRAVPVLASAHEELHPTTTDTTSSTEARSAHSTNATPPTMATRSGGMRRSVPDTMASRTLLESVSAAHAPVDPTSLEGLSEATAESAGAVGTSGVDLGEVPTLGKDSTEPAASVGLGTTTNRPSTSMTLISSLMKPASDHSVVHTATPVSAGETERAGEARAGDMDEDLRALAIVSNRMEKDFAEAATRADLLNGEGPVDWKEIDRDLRQILEGLGLPGIRDASPTGLAWVPWVGAVAGAYLSHRATAGRRRPFRWYQSRRTSPVPLPVGPWPLSSP